MESVMSLRAVIVRGLLLLAICTGLGVVVQPTPVAAESPANPFFETVWKRTDAPVQQLAVSRTWVWGPEAISAPAGEPYADSPGGTRLVQYFDKSRMEINNPDGD